MGTIIGMPISRHPILSENQIDDNAILGAIESVAEADQISEFLAHSPHRERVHEQHRWAMSPGLEPYHSIASQLSEEAPDEVHPLEALYISAQSSTGPLIPLAEELGFAPLSEYLSRAEDLVNDHGRQLIKAVRGYFPMCTNGRQIYVVGPTISMLCMAYFAVQSNMILAKRLAATPPDSILGYTLTYSDTQHRLMTGYRLITKDGSVPSD